jgi:hypothetical protein
MAICQVLDTTRTAARRYVPSIMRLRHPLHCLGLCFALATGAQAAAQSPAPAASACLTSLLGTWRGPGVVLGRQIIMEQRWERVMAGAFTELTMRHLATDTSTRPSFEGRGFYRAVGAGAPDSLTGTWFDARGLTFAIAGNCSGTTLSSHWTGVAERGRTTYELSGDALVVIDSVFPVTGSGREFGRSRLSRTRGAAPSPR